MDLSDDFGKRRLNSLCKSHPEYSIIIAAAFNAVSRAYIEAREKMGPELLNDPLSSQRLGSCVKPCVDSNMSQTLEKINHPGIEVRRMPNSNRSEVHLEIWTSSAIFMVLKSSGNNHLPSPTKYRERYLRMHDYGTQSFFAFDEDITIREAPRNLYVITHTPSPGYVSVSHWEIGTPSPSQNSWDFHASLDDFTADVPAENIVKVQPEERIAKIPIKLKIID